MAVYVRRHGAMPDRERERETYHKLLVSTVHYMISDVALPDPTLVLDMSPKES